MSVIPKPFIIFMMLWWIPFNALGQLAGTPPRCALSCIVPSNYQGCATADTACLCTNPVAVTGVQTCIKQQCTNSTDLNAATTFVQQECNSLTASPSATGTTGSTSTVSAASQATGASSGTNGSPPLLNDPSLVWWRLAPTLLILYPLANTMGPG